MYWEGVIFQKAFDDLSREILPHLRGHNPTKYIVDDGDVGEGVGEGAEVAQDVDVLERYEAGDEFWNGTRVSKTSGSKVDANAAVDKDLG